MALGVNKAVLIGTLGQDPEIKFLSSGQAVCTFSVATNEAWKDKDGQKQEKCTWHRVVAWGKLGELCGEYLQKGRQAYIEGKIDMRKYVDKQGVERVSTEIVAREVQFLGGKNDGQQQGSPQPQQHAQPQAQGLRQAQTYDNNQRVPPRNLGYNEPGTDEDLPF